MSTGPDLIRFEVETKRVLDILAREIYDSPHALLRENVQNAYDAILMRCSADGSLPSSHVISVNLRENVLEVLDDGIGMSDDTLRGNFWTAGSSGKRTPLAQEAGVIGTFGIGAMANFGVCSELAVTTRHFQADHSLVSSVRRDDLRIGEACIKVDRGPVDVPVGTTVRAVLDDRFVCTEEEARRYLETYVKFLPVPVILNGAMLSLNNLRSEAGPGELQIISSSKVKGAKFTANVSVCVDTKGRLFVQASSLGLDGHAVTGEVFLSQDGGRTMGYRNLFGLAPIPLNSSYALGGVVNLMLLQPTAGREALHQSSIDLVNALVVWLERHATEQLAKTDYASTNEYFQNYIVRENLTKLGGRVTIYVYPEKQEIRLCEVEKHDPNKQRYQYLGRDPDVINRFSSEQCNLFHISQANPRRKIQSRFLNLLGVPLVPDRVIVTPVPKSELAIAEAMVLFRIQRVVLEDYLLADAEIDFAVITHGVDIHVDQRKDVTFIAIARSMPALQMTVKCYETARDVFDGIIKDFVRAHLYERIRERLPSSTRQGRDALLKRLRQNRELFRYEESEYGRVEEILSEYIAGQKTIQQVLAAAPTKATDGHHQHVSREQVGTVEEELPDIVSPVASSHSEPPSALLAAPPIIRGEYSSPMKLLSVGSTSSQLNGFRLFLALSDSLVNIEGALLKQPHTTRVLWGAHRVIYIFSDPTGSLSLYYDIELREPLRTHETGGGMLATTTIVTKNRIYIPIPLVLEDAFQLEDGSKEFFVRFDTIASIEAPG